MFDPNYKPSKPPKTIIGWYGRAVGRRYALGLLAIPMMMAMGFVAYGAGDVAGEYFGLSENAKMFVMCFVFMFPIVLIVWWV